MSVEWRAEIWRVESVEKIKIAILPDKNMKISKIVWNIPCIFQNLPELEKTIGSISMGIICQKIKKCPEIEMVSLSLETARWLNC